MIEPEHAVIGIIFFFLVCLVIYLLAIKTKKCRKCPHAGTTNCPACKVNNSQWIKMNGLDPKKNGDPHKNGYNSFCLKSSGTTNDWFKSVVPVLPPLAKGTDGNDPKINGYNKFCNTPGAGGGSW